MNSRIEEFKEKSKHKDEKGMKKYLTNLLDEIIKNDSWKEIEKVIEIDAKLNITGFAEYYYYETLALYHNRFEIFEKLWSVKTKFRNREKKKHLDIF